MKTPIEFVAELSVAEMVAAIGELERWNANEVLENGVVQRVAVQLGKTYGRSDMDKLLQVTKTLIHERVAALWVRDHVYKTYVQNFMEAWPQFMTDEDIDGAELVDFAAAWARDVRQHILENEPDGDVYLERLANTGEEE